MLCLTACEDLDAAEMSVMRDKRGFKCEQCPEGMEGDGTTCHGDYTLTCSVGCRMQSVVEINPKRQLSN